MGQHEYELKALADDQLLSGLASIAHRRNQITAEFLAYLAELDERQLFLDLGYSSLFEFCVEKLQLCESTAGRHIAAARVCRNHPQAFALVASGTLHASALSLLRKHLTPGNVGELFELCSRRSTRKVEELLAVRFPRPDVRDLVRRLPTRPGATLNVGCSTEQASIEVPLRAPSVAPGQAPVEPVSHAPVAPVSQAPVAPVSQAPSVVPAEASIEFLSRVKRRGSTRSRREPFVRVESRVARIPRAGATVEDFSRFRCWRRAPNLRHPEATISRAPCVFAGQPLSDAEGWDGRGRHCDHQ